MGELNIAKNPNSSEKPSKGEATPEGRRGRRREGGVESPLDLSTRNLEQHHQALKEQLYPHNFPFASLQQMLLHSASREGKSSQSHPSKQTSPSASPATPESVGEGSKELSY